MNKYTIISISSFFSLFFLGIYFYGPISTYLQEQALENLYTELGNLPIDNKLKEKIDLLAQEIGVTSPLIVNKMNCNATQLLGYHNCFITYPRSCLNIITFNKPHMFISEGFFENLSVDEQRFILGHELIHVREGHHGRYFTLISMSIKICTLLSLIGIAYLFLFCFKKKLRSDKIKKNTLYAVIDSKSVSEI